MTDLYCDAKRTEELEFWRLHHVFYVPKGNDIDLAVMRGYNKYNRIMKEVLLCEILRY